MGIPLKHLKPFLIGLIITCCLPIQSTLAFESKDTGFDSAWRHLTLYENEEGTVIQKFALVGRAQVDSFWVNPEDGEDDNDTLWRRLRFGFKADIFTQWVAHLEADLDLNEPIGDWYSQLTDAYIAWSSSESLKIKLLKQSAGFTLDGATSSKRLLTLERNNLTNNLWFTEEYFNGILASGKIAEAWRYKASLFSSDGDPELGWGGASWFSLLSMGYSFSNTALGLAYVYQDEDENANTRDFKQILSLTGKWQGDGFGVWGDLSFGDGFSAQGQSDVWGLVLMPFYNFSKHTQAVFRYTHLASEADNGVRLNRYEDTVVDGRGDRYDEIYAGINLFFYGHKFKWQTGVTWANMEDKASDSGEYEGWTLATGIRIYW